MPIADINLGDMLIIVVEVMFLVIWLWILFAVITDLFRDHKMSGWGKAAWVLFLVIIPLFACLIYLIARGDGMRERAVAAQNEARQQMDSYIREQAQVSPADELQKLSALKEKGTLSPQEFETAKAKLLA